MVRAPCCEKEGVKKGPWTPEEDQVLVAYVQQHGHDNWRKLPKKAGLLRCGKSCRLRWTNYLRPDIKRGNFTKEEEAAIIELHEQLGNRWSAIAGKLPGRTDNEIKNVWHTHLKKTAGVGGAPPEHKRKAKRGTGATSKKKRKDAAMPTKPQAIRPLEAAAAALQPDAAAEAAAGAQNCTSPADGPASPSSSLCSVISYASSAGAGATEALMDSLEAFLDVEDVIVDESFWSEAYLSLDSSSSTGADMMSDWTSTMTTSLASPFDDCGGGGGGGVDDEVGYWLKVFMEAGDFFSSVSEFIF